MLAINKTQRCFALLKLLQKRPRNSVELASELGVNERTIFRYIADLRVIGYNIRGKTGGRGYYELVSEEESPQK